MTSPEWTEVLRKRLAAIGVEVRVQTFTGDSSYPVEYTLIAGSVRTFGEPTLDAALVSLIGELLKVTSTDEVTSYRAMETALQGLSGNILALRTELLVVKAQVAEQEPILRDCEFCGGAHYTGQVCPLAPQAEQAQQEYEDTRKYMEHHSNAWLLTIKSYVTGLIQK